MIAENVNCENEVFIPNNEQQNEGDQPQARTSLVWRKPGRGRLIWDLERRGLTHVSPLSLPLIEDNETPPPCLQRPAAAKGRFGVPGKTRQAGPRWRSSTRGWGSATPFGALPRENHAEVPTHSPSDE
ncbi:hypothetical protein J6590_106768 [Homalodisca vitripennis]|nr:hypothetical protein J6590_106768 [Homalodisca vitripennis]